MITALYYVFLAKYQESGCWPGVDVLPEKIPAAGHSPATCRSVALPN